MAESPWHDLGAVEELSQYPLQQVVVGRTRLAVSYVNGAFSVVSGACNHVGGPLGDGRLDGDYIVCPWHNYKFHRVTGEGEPGFEDDRVPRHESKVQNGRLLVNLEAATTRSVKHHPHPLGRKVERAPGPLRVVGISTTAMDEANPRFSTSEALLMHALEHAAAACGADTRLVKLRELRFRPCEGNYSKASHACTWPCAITERDPEDQLTAVYDGLVNWADVVLLATPIRWGSAAALYFRMAERLNCVQNQVTIHNRVLIRHKVASFIITGGQDNIQGVAGGLFTFWSELGFVFPPFPFIAHSRGWDAEDMQNNVRQVRESEALRLAARELVGRALAFWTILDHHKAELEQPMERAGRKANPLVRETAEEATV